MHRIFQAELTNHIQYYIKKRAANLYALESDIVFLF